MNDAPISINPNDLAHEYREACAELQQQLVIAKAQVSALIRKNQALHAAMETQEEVDE